MAVQRVLAEITFHEGEHTAAQVVRALSIHVQHVADEPRQHGIRSVLREAVPEWDRTGREDKTAPAMTIKGHVRPYGFGKTILLFIARWVVSARQKDNTLRQARRRYHWWRLIGRTRLPKFARQALRVLVSHRIDLMP